ncbi:MAG: hypothetical protein Q8912_14875 [Bacillota bacterium]|nr:hypothetical protein [Bacillota bacterium]
MGAQAHRVEDTYNLVFKTKIITECKEKTEDELKQIDQILAELSLDPGCEHFGLILKEWYVYRTPKDDIADRIGYSRRNLYNIREQALKKFAIQYFGLDALRL